MLLTMIYRAWFTNMLYVCTILCKFKTNPCRPVPWQWQWQLQRLLDLL